MSLIINEWISMAGDEESCRVTLGGGVAVLEARDGDSTALIRLDLVSIEDLIRVLMAVRKELLGSK